MANYTYGPPPPAPPPAQQAPTGYYPHSYQQGAPRGGGRGGHTSGGRGDYQGHAYGYNAQPHQQYGPNPPQQGGYGPPQWQQDQQHVPAPQAQPHHPAPVMLPAQNYHPNFAPHVYQQSSYSQQNSYQPPAQGYNPQYQQPAQATPPRAQAWGPPSHVPHSSQGPQNNAQFGAGRGRGGHHNDRGGPKAPMMGPPIRWGFNQSAPDQNAPVSTQYPPQQFGPPQAGPTPYASGPYQPYSGPPHTGGVSSHGPPHHGRGGFNHGHGSARGGRFNGKRPFKKHGHNSHHAAVPNAHHQKPDAASSGKKKKRKTNTLGLTPGDESEEEDDADEETRLAELYLADAPQPESISAWIAERRQNFPTQARAKAKLANASNGGKNKNDAQDSALALQKQQQKAEKLRKQLEKVESSIKRKREQQDEGDEMRDVDRSNSVSSDSKSDDEGPETLPSRPDMSSVPPPARKADPTKHCKYFSTGGVCGKKNKCRFVHDASVREAALKAREMNGGRMTLQQRLVLNDKDQEDLTIVKTLQYLKDKGAMKKTANQSSDEVAVKSESSTATPAHLPPPPASAPDVKMETPPSLPPQPSSLPENSKPYAGWNLGGFGGSGVKPGDL